MKKIVKVGLFLFLLIIIYAIAWYAGALKLCKNINALKEDNNSLIFTVLDEPILVSFDKVVPYGFPFKFGVRFINLAEESKEPITSQKYTISHKGIVSVSYDLLKQGMLFANKGDSVVRIKPFSSGFGTKITSDNACFIKMPLTIKLLKQISNFKELFELVNFIKNIQITANNVKAYDLIDNRLLFDHEATKIVLGWHKTKYYLSFEDFQQNIPDQYLLDMQIDIKQAADDKKIIAPISLVYFILGNHSFKIMTNFSFSTKAKTFNLSQMISQMQFRINNFSFNNNVLDTKIDAEINNDEQTEQKNCTFKFNLDFLLKDTLYFKDKFASISALLSNKINMLENEQLFNDLLSEPPSFNISSEGNYSFGKSIKNINLDSLYFAVNDDMAINFKGHSSFASIRNWYVDSNILLYNFEKIIDLIANFLVKYRSYNSAMIDIQKEDFKLLLRGVSAYPASNSQDLSINLQLSHDLNNSKIGNIPLRIFLSNYQKALEQN